MLRVRVSPWAQFPRLLSGTNIFCCLFSLFSFFLKPEKRLTGLTSRFIIWVCFYFLSSSERGYICDRLGIFYRLGSHFVMSIHQWHECLDLMVQQVMRLQDRDRWLFIYKTIVLARLVILTFGMFSLSDRMGPISTIHRWESSIYELSGSDMHLTDHI